MLKKKDINIFVGIEIRLNNNTYTFDFLGLWDSFAPKCSVFQRMNPCIL